MKLTMGLYLAMRKLPSDDILVQKDVALLSLSNSVKFPS